MDKRARFLEDRRRMRWRRALLVSALASISASTLGGCSSCEEPRDERATEGPAVPDEATLPRPTVARTSFELENGLDVEVIAGPCGDRAGIALLVEVGADHDPPARSGTAALAARLLAGAPIVVASGRDHTLFSREVPVDRLAAGLDDVAERLRAPALDDDAFSIAKDEVLAAIAARHGGDPAETAESFAAQSIAPSAGGGFRGGVATEVGALDRAAIEGLLREHFRAGNARLVIVVDRAHAAGVRALVEPTFGALPRGAPPVAREAEGGAVHGTIVMGATPSTLALAVAAPAPADPLYPAFLILAARLLGAGDGAWNARYDAIDAPDVLFVTSPLQPNELPDAASARVRGAIGPRLAAPLDDDDVAGTLERFAPLAGDDAPTAAACADDPRALAAAEARRAQLGLVDPPLAARLAAVTDERLREAAALFEPHRSVAVVAGGEIR